MNPATTNPGDLRSLVQQLKGKGALLSSRKVTAGFDGFIDTIIKIIRQKEGDSVSHFNTLGEFGKYVSDHSTSSFSLEAEEVNIKIGGNMPIMANAMGTLGIAVNCVGAFGYPQTHHAFDSLSPNCRRFSFADPGTSNAYEFNNGKMMVGNMAQLNSLGWEDVKERIGLETLKNIFRESDLLCLVNWSEIDISAKIWKGVLAEIMPSYSKPDQQLFIDLSDCSKRDDRSVLDMIGQINQFSKFTKVTLGLNKNESKKIGNVLGIKTTDDLSANARKLFEKSGIDCLLVHSNQEALGITKDNISVQKCFFTQQPGSSTAAGDHFNAGFTAGRLLGLDLTSCLLLGHGVSGYYVRSASSPALNELITFLNEMS